jgi:hypothetical protein
MSEAAERPRMTMDNMIEKYVKIRDKKKVLEDQHKEAMKPYTDTLDRLEAYMLEAMNQSGLKSMKSPHGTAYQAVRTSAKVTDWPAALGYIREHQAWDLLEARISKLALQELTEATKDVVPGVETSSEVVVNVRRATDTKTLSTDRE